MSLDRVAVIGAGTMGHGIAHVAAVAGCHVALVDADEDALERGMTKLRENLDGGVQRGKLSEEARDAALERVHATTDLAAAVADADLVVEAVPERMELKESIFAALDEYAPPAAILATNTSSLSVTTIQRATRRADRVLGLHFFNPVHAMKLVEVVRGEDTSDDTVGAGAAFSERLGKEPIIVRDSPGFASSRLGIALGLEAMRMVEEGVAEPEAIDRAMELGYRHPMGPLRLTDLVGLDVRLGIAEYLHETLHSDVFRPPEILKRMVAEGRLGKKSGRGFYSWD